MPLLPSTRTALLTSRPHPAQRGVPNPAPSAIGKRQWGRLFGGPGRARRSAHAAIPPLRCDLPHASSLAITCEPARRWQAARAGYGGAMRVLESTIPRRSETGCSSASPPCTDRCRSGESAGRRRSENAFLHGLLLLTAGAPQAGNAAQGLFRRSHREASMRPSHRQASARTTPRVGCSVRATSDEPRTKPKRAGSLGDRRRAVSRGGT